MNVMQPQPESHESSDSVWGARTVLHLDLDTFFVSVERLIDSRLNNKPVLVGGMSDRGVVASCSYEARRFGIHSGMPMKMARHFCPEAIVIRGNTAQYTEYSKAVTDIVSAAVPILEKSSIDEFYADLSGMDRFFGCTRMAQDLRKRVMRETGLPISCGLSINKTVSKIATGEAKPNNARAVVRGTEKTFLAPLSVRKIPMVGEKMHHSLRGLGIQHIHTLQHMPPDLLQRVFGQSGLQLWKKANGEDHAPVVPFSERKSISTERTFERDTTDLQKIKGILTAMTENLAFQLRRGGRLCACVAVKIRYSDFQTVSMQKQIAYSSADHVLIPLVGELFQRLYNRRMLIRLVGVRFSDLVSGGVQLRLFEQVPQAHQLYEAMDRMRERFGDRAVVRASGLMARTIGRENPFNGEPPPLLANRRL